MFTWLKLHLREYVEQDFCIEVKLQGSHRRDHGPDRDANGSSEEAAAHHAPSKQLTTRQTLEHYNIQEHDTVDLSLELHGGQGRQTLQKLPNTTTLRPPKESHPSDEHQKQESTYPNQQPWTPESSNSKKDTERLANKITKRS